jgi:hypothetical protein
MMFTDLTNQQYHNRPEISSSDVKAVALKSLAHWHYGERKESAAFDLGTSVHAMILEPEKALVRKGPADRRTNDWKEKKMAADLDGVTLLPAAEYDLAEKMSQAVLQDVTAKRLLGQHDLVREASFFALDPVTGMHIKCRPDAYSPTTGLVIDIKTTADASPRAFARDVAKFGYDLQVAFYLRVLEAAGFKATEFVFICVEKEPPFAVGCHMLSPEYVASSQVIVTHTLHNIRNASLARRFTTGWPEINVIDLPSWRREQPDSDEALSNL